MMLKQTCIEKQSFADQFHKQEKSHLDRVAQTSSKYQEQIKELRAELRSAKQGKEDEIQLLAT
jgi:hypothetical protein